MELTICALPIILWALYVLLERARDRRLDRFPGPFAARWTAFYKEWYETVHSDWVGKLEHLHLHYGPIVRVGPRELHFSNPDAYHEIYAVGSKFNKDPRTYSAVSSFLHLFGVFDAHKALLRRSMVHPYFSKRSVLDRESIVQEKVESFINGLVNLHTRDKAPMDIEITFRPFYAEVIPMFCFPDLDQCSALKESGLLPSITDTPDRNTIWFWMKNLPPFVVKALTSTTTRISAQEAEALQLVADEALRFPLSELDDRNSNFFHTLLRRSASSRPESPRRWLASEALNLKFAGVDTTANVVFLAIRAVLAHDEICRRLVKELNEAWPDLEARPSLPVLEKLPYLTAVIKEGLRLSMGVLAPMNRVVGPEDTMISGASIPAGTTVGMSNSFVHLHPDIFPEPQSFNPDRWLQEDSQKLEKYLVTFSKGPRSCVGMQFAWCMMYLLMANVFRKLDFYPISLEDLRSPYKLKDDFVSIYVGPPALVHVELKY